MLEDGREVIVEFIADADAVVVRETFDAESENSAAQQRQGWQAILGSLALMSPLLTIDRTLTSFGECHE